MGFITSLFKVSNFLLLRVKNMKLLSEGGKVMQSNFDYLKCLSQAVAVITVNGDIRLFKFKSSRIIWGNTKCQKIKFFRIN